MTKGARDMLDAACDDEIGLSGPDGARRGADRIEPEPQSRLIAFAPPVGSPARRAAIRATLRLSSPA